MGSVPRQSTWITSLVSSRKTLLPRFHVITDEVLQTRYTHVQLAEIALAAGAGAIQYREKRLKTTREHINCASEIETLCSQYKAMLVINDRVDVATTLSNVAVHLGEDDLPVKHARKILGKSTIIGGTANSVEQASKVASSTVDYLGVGPVFGTTSKAKSAPKLGLSRLQDICRNTEKPVIAIGNIRPENVTDVLQAGAWGFAVLSGVVCNANVSLATKEYVDALNLVLRPRD